MPNLKRFARNCLQSEIFVWCMLLVEFDVKMDIFSCLLPTTALNSAPHKSTKCRWKYDKTLYMYQSGTFSGIWHHCFDRSKFLFCLLYFWDFKLISRCFRWKTTFCYSLRFKLFYLITGNWTLIENSRNKNMARWF